MKIYKPKPFVGLCHQCYTSNVEIKLTIVGENDKMQSKLPLCKTCRNKMNEKK